MNPPPLQKINCPHPEHDDPKPSCAIYGEEDVWCFGCERGYTELAEYLDSAQTKMLGWGDLEALATGQSRTLVHSYTYTDEHGNPVRRKNRFEPKDFRWEHWDGEGWVSGFGSRPLLYNLPSVLKSSTIYLVEGEKAADRLIQAGICATTPGGANNWKPELAPYLKGKEVIILPDNDEAGQRFARSVSQTLRKAKIVNLPGLESKQDPYDWLEHHDIEDLVKVRSTSTTDAERLTGLLIDRTPKTVKETREPDKELTNLYTLGGDDLLNIEVPEFLVEGRIQKNCLAQLAGPSGAGKSLFALDIALKMSSGQKLNLYGEKPARVLYLAAEGMSGQFARINAWRLENNTEINSDMLRFRGDVPSLLEESFTEYLEMIRITGPWDLVIVDTLARAIPGADENNAQDMGIVVRRANDIQLVCGGTVLLVHHFGWANNRQRGSSALFGACDNVIYAEPGEIDGQRVLTIRTAKLKDGDPAADQLYTLNGFEGSAVLREIDAAVLRADNDEEAVLSVLQTQTEAVSSETVKTGAGINRNHVVPALERLRDRGEISETPGPRNARMWGI